MVIHRLVPQFILDHYARRHFSGQMEAASLFVDVSGFTALTDALMRHGKEGAETLAGVMCAIFEPLVDSLYARGGFIAGFAGDAFMALFPAAAGPAGEITAACQALAAAADMQQHLAANTVRATPYGTFTFSAKLGLAAGPVEWGILAPAGAKQHVYYFRGEAIDGCAQAEQQAQSGELRLSRVMAQRVQAIAAVAPVADYFRVIRLADGLPVPRQPEAAPYALAEAGAFFDAALLTQPTQGEFRQVVSAFINLPGNLARPELEAFAGACCGLLRQYEGYLCRLDFGDKGCRLLLFWGAPASFENNVERALNFMLDLKAATPLELRAGLSSGLAYAGFVGSAWREEYTCYSSRVNLAARLMTGAPWGKIWLDEAVAQQAGRHFTVELTGHFPFKGFVAPQPVYTLADRRAKINAALYQGNLIGREHELAELQDFMAPIFAEAGHFAGVLTLYGEAGLGKSRLLYELEQACRQRAHPPLWLVCPCDDPVLRQSLSPFRHLLRRYFDQRLDRSVEANRTRFDEILDAQISKLRQSAAGGASPAAGAAGPPQAKLADELERTRSILGALVGLHWEASLYEQLEPKLRFENTWQAFKTLIQAESLSRPVMVVIEDAHWLDADSHKLLWGLTSHTADYRVGVLLASRYQDDGGKLRLELEPEVPRRDLELNHLRADSLRAFAAQVLNHTLSADLVAFLSEKTNGNPFFIEQLLLDWRERELLVRDAKPGGEVWTLTRQAMLAVPANINAVLIARLDRLAAEVRTVVQTAAVLGREFEVQVLSQMLGDEAQVPAKVRQAEAEAIWSAMSEIRYLFKHALMRDAAYEMQLRASLRELHALALDALETVYAAHLAPHYSELAYHAEGCQNVAKQALYYARAGEAAAAAYANAAAVDYYERWLSLLTGGPAQVEVRLKLGAVLEVEGRWDGAEARYQQALVLAEAGAESGAVARCQAALSSLLSKKGDYAAARAWSERARAGWAALKDSRGVCAALLQLGSIAWRQGEYASARRHLDESLALARREGDRAAIALALNDLANVAHDQGNYPAAQQLLEEALALVRGEGDKQTLAGLLNNLGGAMLEQGHLAEAQTALEESLTLNREIGHKQGVAYLLDNLGILADYQHDYERGRQLHAESLAISREMGDKYGVATALGSLGNAALAQSEPAAAQTCYTESLTLCREMGDKLNFAGTLVGLAALAAGYPTEAEAAPSVPASGRAARLAAAAESMLTAIGGTMVSDEAALYARVVAAARAALGEAAFAAAVAEGRAMTLEQAAAYALEREAAHA